MRNTKVKLSGICAAFVIGLAMTFGGFCNVNKNITRAAGGDIITISTAAELYAFSYNVTNKIGSDAQNGYSGKTILLTEDIDLSDYQSGQGWLCIGNNSTNAHFRGTFDGAGHTISNMYINQQSSTVSSVGLFAFAYNATIKNVTIKNSTIIGGWATYIGAVVGCDSNGKIINCHSDNVTVTSSGTSSAQVGGIAGYGYYTEIRGCTVNNCVLGCDNNYSLGGIIGYFSYMGSVSDCMVINTELCGSIDNEPWAASCFVGGICGSCYGTNFSNCIVIVREIKNNWKYYYDEYDEGTWGFGKIIGDARWGDATFIDMFVWEGTQLLFNGEVYEEAVFGNDGTAVTIDEILENGLLTEKFGLVFDEEIITVAIEYVQSLLVEPEEPEEPEIPVEPEEPETPTDPIIPGVTSPTVEPQEQTITVNENKTSPWAVIWGCLGSLLTLASAVGGFFVFKRKKEA
jgi:hypothetical protein